MKAVRSMLRNYEIVADALRGTAQARALHASYLSGPITAEAGVKHIQERFESPDGPDSAPVFVLAAGWRTGSTLLQRLLIADQLLMWGEPYSHCALIDTLAAQVRAFNAKWPKQEFFLTTENAANLENTWVANLYPAIEQFRRAHIAFFNELFAEPAAALGRSNWGLKEVLLSSDHACYLRWLFPRAKFIFLYRNPYHAWHSYRRWRRWYRRWPDEPVHTPRQFGAMWRAMTNDFVNNYQKVNGLLVRYEQLKSADTQAAIEAYLGHPVVAVESLPHVSGGSVKSDKRYIPRLEKMLLMRQVEPLAAKLGYRL